MEFQQLKDTLDNIMMIRKMDAQLETYYLRRDMQHILELSTSAYQEIEDPVLREKLVQGVLHARNTTLFSRAVPELAKGNGFLAVGVLHLLHDDGILAQMENAGYAIFPASSR